MDSHRSRRRRRLALAAFVAASVAAAAAISTVLAAGADPILSKGAGAATHTAANAGQGRLAIPPSRSRQPPPRRRPTSSTSCSGRTGSGRCAPFLPRGPSAIGRRRRHGGGRWCGASAAAEGAGAASSSPSWSCVVLGDLHLDPDDMEAHHEARGQLLNLLEHPEVRSPPGTRRVLSLGDLGAYGSAGTTASFEHARDYLDGFGLPLSIVTGNHDLEGMHEFATDRENLDRWRGVFGVEGEWGQFATEVAPGVLLVGLSTEGFRSNPFSSHEVRIGDGQMEWFEAVLAAHPLEEGWSIVVASHAPPMGSGLRVLNSVHVRNTCAWLNHAAGPAGRRFFHRAARSHGGIVCWLSGHFHLSHDYEESISVVRGTHPGAVSAFCQVGVIGPTSTRDGRRQSRILSSDGRTLKVWSVDHHVQGVQSDFERLRLDLEIPLSLPDRAKRAARGERIAPAPLPASVAIRPGSEAWFSAQTPREGDGCYLPIQSPSGEEEEKLLVDQDTEGAVCWWHMDNGAVLGIHDGMLLEYDAETLAPLGVLVSKEDLDGRMVEVAEDGIQVKLVADNKSSGPEESDVLTISPNENGSYFRIFQTNKWLRWKREQEQQAASPGSSYPQ